MEVVDDYQHPGHRARGRPVRAGGPPFADLLRLCGTLLADLLRLCGTLLAERSGSLERLPSLAEAAALAEQRTEPPPAVRIRGIGFRCPPGPVRRLYEIPGARAPGGEVPQRRLVIRLAGHRRKQVRFCLVRGITGARDHGEIVEDLRALSPRGAAGPQRGPQELRGTAQIAGRELRFGLVDPTTHLVAICVHAHGHPSSRAIAHVIGSIGRLLNCGEAQAEHGATD